MRFSSFLLPILAISISCFFGCKTSTANVQTKIPPPSSSILQIGDGTNESRISNKYSAKALQNKIQNSFSHAEQASSTTSHLSRGVSHVATLAPKRSNPPNNQRETTASISPEFYGLFISIEQYDHPNMPDLDYPIQDATRIKRVLNEKYGFSDQNSVLLQNPRRRDIFAAFSNFQRRIGEADSFLIFYAGHGKWIENNNQGYWLPADAAPEDRANWISNNEIKDWIRGIRSRKTMVIADACFSGALINPRSIPFNKLKLNEMFSYKSRVALASIEKGEVPDDSAFIEHLIRALESNQDEWIDSRDLFVKIYPSVHANSLVNQKPQYGIIPHSGHEEGDFIFIKYQ